MVHRAGMANHLLAKVDELALTERDTLVQNAPVTFDISVWQMLTPLVVGGRVRVVDRAHRRRPRPPVRARRRRRRHRPRGRSLSLLRAALDAWELTGAGMDLPGLRHLMVTGEALPADPCRRWLAHYPGTPLVNAYGPTECSDDVTHARIVHAPASDRPVPIGVPVRNTRLYVLGDDLRPLAHGIPGELCIAGAGVGRGYLADPARTAGTFVPDPYGPAGTRMYAHRRPRPLGRRRRTRLPRTAGHQVKIRGHLHRTRRDRDHSAPPRGRRRRRRHGHGRRLRRQAPRRPLRPPRAHRPRHRSAPRAPGGEPARVHGAAAPPRPRRAAADRPRQGRPQGTAPAPDRPREHRPRPGRPPLPRRGAPPRRLHGKSSESPPAPTTTSSSSAATASPPSRRSATPARPASPSPRC